MREFVSILMLTHDAPEYVSLAIRTVKNLTEEVEFELIVVDNASRSPTRELLKDLRSHGLIDKFELLDRNSLFAEGNNIAARMASSRASHLLLLNSDIEVKDARWLRNLLDGHERGISAYGVALDPARVDGYCLLIDADLFHRHQLDESHQWWWSVTKLQARILQEGYSVRGYQEHEKYVHHFGGKSGSGFQDARGMNVSREEVLEWFAGKTPKIIT